MMGTERFINVIDRIFEITHGNAVFFNSDEKNMFLDGRVLFNDCTPFELQRLRAMETDFGILPYPKFDESQLNYVSRIEYYFTTQIPITNSDVERAGVMLEALNSYSAKTVIPAFYEIALKAKHARDDDSAEMLELILNTLVIDIGDTTLCDRIRDGFMANMFETNNRNLASRIESTERIIQRFIDQIPLG
jgi:hypothetical protein